MAQAGLLELAPCKSKMKSCKRHPVPTRVPFPRRVHGNIRSFNLLTLTLACSHELIPPSLTLNLPVAKPRPGLQNLDWRRPAVDVLCRHISTRTISRGTTPILGVGTSGHESIRTNSCPCVSAKTGIGGMIVGLLNEWHSGWRCWGCWSIGGWYLHCRAHSGRGLSRRAR